jgi:transcriptional regulator with XRE-family HTH domain
VSGFSEDMRRRIELVGIPQAQLAATVHVSPSYLSLIVNGHRTPHAKLAELIDTALEAHGALAALLDQGPAAEVAVGAPMGSDDVQQLQDTIAHLVALDTMHGSEGLYSNAARAFRNAHRKLAIVGARPGTESDLHVAIAELGEVAAWLAYDSEHQDVSRQVAGEAMLVARLAGDKSMERFLLSHLSMQAVYLGRGAEGLQLADRILAESPNSGRVVGMVRVRRARALGKLGNGGEALAELERARGELAGGVGPADPAWTWWLHEAELAVHEARIKADVGDNRGAIASSEHSVLALPERQGRDQALYRAWLVQDLVNVRGWRDAGRVVEDIIGIAEATGSARVPRLLRLAGRSAGRAGAPRWLVDDIDEAVQASDPAA